MNTVIVTSFIIVFVIIFFYRLFKHYEYIVCTEVCNIFSSMVMTLDQLCAINSDIKSMWKQLMFDFSMTGDISYEASRKYKETVSFSKKKLDEILRIIPTLPFSQSIMSSIVLYKHKMSIGDVVTCDNYISATIAQLRDLIEMVQTNIDAKQSIQSNLLLIDAEIECFQLEANAGFYAIMEGMCSFPESTKSTYMQLYPRVKFLPIEVGHNRRKEEYSFLQNQSYDEAENRIRRVREALSIDEKLVKEYANTIFHRDVNFFFAGAKKLQDERDMFTNIISQLQTNKKDSLISIYGYSYQNFDRKIIDGGHEEEYCNFIRTHTDSIIFVLNERIGDYTLLELNVALESFKQSGKPNIYVYSKQTNCSSDLFIEAKQKVVEEKQFWIDYEDNQQLRLLIERDLLIRLGEIERNIDNERKKLSV